MKNLLQTLRKCTIVLLVLLILWIIFMIISTTTINPEWSNLEYAKHVSNLNSSFILTYVNATLFTIVVVILFGLLYLWVKSEYPKLAITGILFIPIFGLINILAYASQIIVIPGLFNSVNLETLSATELNQLTQWIHVKPNTIMATFNGFAYALLGIPSVCFAIPLVKKKFNGMMTAYFLIANAFFCLLGLIGMAIQNFFLSKGILFGGFIFTIAIIFLHLLITKEIKTDSESESVSPTPSNENNLLDKKVFSY